MHRGPVITNSTAVAAEVDCNHKGDVGITNEMFQKQEARVANVGSGVSAAEITR